MEMEKSLNTRPGYFLDPVTQRRVFGQCMGLARDTGMDEAMDYVRRTYRVASGRFVDLDDQQLLELLLWLISRWRERNRAGVAL